MRPSVAPGFGEKTAKTCKNAYVFPLPTPSSSVPTTSDTAPSSQSTASSTSVAPSSSSKEPGDYLFYKLKEGQTKEGLEGVPWVNSVKESIGKKLVKTSEKDDFYLGKTYEMQNTAILEPGDMAIGGLLWRIHGFFLRVMALPLQHDAGRPLHPRKKRHNMLDCINAFCTS